MRPIEGAAGCWQATGSAGQAQRADSLAEHAEVGKRAALTRLGEMLKATPKNKGMAGSVVTGSTREPVKDTTPTLADLGIDKKVRL